MNLPFANSAVAAVYAAAALGLRHSLEAHQIAAIGDFSSSADSSPRAGAMVALYTAGHIAAIAGLGASSVCLGLALPKAAAPYMTRLVGLTLVAFGAYVLYALFASPGTLTRHSRITLLMEGWRRLVAWFRRRPHHAGHAVDWTSKTANRGAFALGIVHGLGIETPTQLALFILAAGARGLREGLLCVLAFVAALALMTALMTLFSLGLLTYSGAQRWVHGAVMLGAGLYSVIVGAALTIGVIS